MDDENDDDEYVLCVCVCMCIIYIYISRNFFFQGLMYNNRIENKDTRQLQ